MHFSWQMCALCSSWRSCLTLHHVTLCGLVIYYKWYCILSVDSLPTLSTGRASKVVCQLPAPSNPQTLTVFMQSQPHPRALKVKGTTADLPGKSLISQSPIWSSAVHCSRRDSNVSKGSSETSAASYSPSFLCKNDTFWQPSCCADFVPGGKTCEVMQSWC